MSGQVRRSVVHPTSLPFEAPVIARILLITLAELTLTVSARLRYLGNAGKPLSVSPFWPGLEQNGECSPLPTLSPAPLPAASGASQPSPEQRQAALGPHPARR